MMLSGFQYSGPCPTQEDRAPTTSADLYLVPHQQQQPTPNLRAIMTDSSKETAALACVTCRRRHLKCDGLQPTCSRCIATSERCQYVKSRRGMRPIKHTSRRPSHTPSDLTSPTAGAPTPIFSSVENSQALTTFETGSLDFGASPFHPALSQLENAHFLPSSPTMSLPGEGLDDWLHPSIDVSIPLLAGSSTFRGILYVVMDFN